MDKRTEIFESYSIPKALAALALPTILNQLATTLYNLADTFLVGQLGDPNMVAAISLCMPVNLLMGAFGSLFGIGGASLISRSLGARQPENAKRTATFSFYAAAAASLLFSLIVLIFLDPFCRLAGASPDTITYVEQYIIWTFVIGGIPTVLTLTLGSHIRAEGGAKHEMLGMVGAHACNLILDPILIFPFKLGVAGAAIATMISNVMALAYYLYYIRRKEGATVLSVRPSDFSFDFKLARSILSVGLPAALTTALNSVAAFIMNNMVVVYGDIAVAAVGIVRRIDHLPLGIVGGLANGILPLVGYNFAAKNYKRMRAFVRYTLLFSVFICIIFAALAFVFSRWFIWVFIRDEQTILYGVKIIRIFAFTLPLGSVGFILTTTFQAMGKGVQSLVLSLCRRGLIFIPALFLMDWLFGFYGLMWAQVAADGLSAFIAFSLYLGCLKRLPAFHDA